jgi:flavin-dependent dehydrogenase
MGLEPALWSGRAAAAAVRETLLDTADPEARLEAYQAGWEERYGPAYREMATFSPSFWAFSDTMWEFVFNYDLRKLKPKKFLERMKHNAHRMKWGTFSRRYLRYRMGKLLSKT